MKFVGKNIEKIKKLFSDFPVDDDQILLKSSHFW